MVLDKINFCPSGEYHFVRFTEVPEQTESGIYLPETCRENFIEAEVLASGKGKKFDGEHITPLWAKPGDIVIFQKHLFIPLVGQKEGLVRDSELVAIVYPNHYDNNIFPMNDWVMIDRCDEEAFEGSILIPEEYRTRHKRGRVLNWGPGQLVKFGKLAGKRLNIRDILGVDMSVVSGKFVRWSDDAVFLTVMYGDSGFVFVKASDLDYVECT